MVKVEQVSKSGLNLEMMACNAFLKETFQHLRVETTQGNVTDGQCIYMYKALGLNVLSVCLHKPSQSISSWYF